MAVAGRFSGPPPPSCSTVHHPSASLEGWHCHLSSWLRGPRPTEQQMRMVLLTPRPAVPGHSPQPSLGKADPPVPTVRPEPKAGVAGSQVEPHPRRKKQVTEVRRKEDSCKNFFFLISWVSCGFSLTPPQSTSGSRWGVGAGRPSELQGLGGQGPPPPGGRGQISATGARSSARGE